ncbi:MAG TPA: HEAT repeat domain-containing protein [Tepidisphaeraceae bacterium]|nr:HEAT repeat domain-containing protein [Tepidisphaeraceae bacterium]
MHDQILQIFIESDNAAADDVLLEGLRLGTEPEKAAILDALFRRQSVRGRSGVIGYFDHLSPPLQQWVLARIRELHSALRECGRSSSPDLRLAALKLISLGRQGKLAYVLSENLHRGEENVSKAAADALLGLAWWISAQTKALQHGDATIEGVDRAVVYEEIIDQRPEIESAVMRAVEIHRGKHGADLVRAALLLMDWPGSKSLAALSAAKHGGQSVLVRRLQQPPLPEHVEAFLISASHAQLRTHFGSVFAHIADAPVLDAILRKTYWLKDTQLQLCMHQVTRGQWWGDAELVHDITRRTPADAALIGEWIGASGSHDVLQDERLERLRQHAAEDFGARLRLLRIAMRRRRGASVELIKTFLSDSDERIARMAAREMIRRRPPEYESLLLQRMTTAPLSVRKLITRSLGHVGFEAFWQRFDRMDRETRGQAGRAMLKMLPDAVQRLGRRLATGPIDERLKAMQMTHELGLSEPLKDMLAALSAHMNSKVRSKAVSVLGDVPAAATDTLIERALNDSDSRVRANAVEVLEERCSQQFIPVLASRARAGHNRERANAIKALHRLRVVPAADALLAMLRDSRPEHRVSAMWALKQIGWWKLLNEVGRLAKEDSNFRVRRYALAVLRGVAEMAQASGKAG